MHPGASVSGLYFSHPDAKYFGVGKIARDQAEDYAARKGEPLSVIEKWLAPNLGYEPCVADQRRRLGICDWRSRASPFPLRQR